VSNIVVKNGTGTGAEGSPVNGAQGTLIDTGCEAEGIAVKRTFTTNSEGKLPYPGLPYGNYSLCVTATIGTQARKYTTTFQNNTPAGPTVKVFLGNGTLASGCP
jgi:hypothetical protein